MGNNRYTMADQISFTIDGKAYTAQAGVKLMDFAREQGIFLPSLCYYEHIDPPLATCRACLVRINGRPTAGCTIHLQDGMNIEIQNPELEDLRKAMVEMLFAEGNHFCPACEKSGDCDLQGLGYKMGIRVSRFPHLFVDRLIDFRPKRLIIEHNRCVLCRRCVEEVTTPDGKRIFSFVNRGHDTEVAVDYELEATLTEEEALRAMRICPVGAILVRGKSLSRPLGDRKYDVGLEEKELPDPPITVSPQPHAGKKIIATTSLAGCFGCHMSLLDIDEGLLDLIDLVEFNKSPLTDIKKFTKRCDVGIIEGGCCNDDNVEVLKAFRENCDVLISVGECAIWGGLPAMRNTIPLEECLREAYLNSPTVEAGQQVVPRHDDLPKILDKVYACHEVVHIDYYIPGCPPSAAHIWKVVKNILFGTDYSILGGEFKYD